METLDGFIVGIFNYCDRWCEHCTLSRRCRVFADHQRLAAELPAAPTEPPATLPGATPILRSLGAVVAAFEELPDPPLFVPDREDPYKDPVLTPREAELRDRTQAIGEHFWNWVAPEGHADGPVVKDAVAVLQHFSLLLYPKVCRALRGRHEEEWRDADSDANGTAKVVLGALDRLGEAWLRLAEEGAISLLEAAPRLSEVQHLIGELETLFPRARDFVRPGFDEPAEVARLEWLERG